MNDRKFDNGPVKKPPLGVMPRYIWDERRLGELNEAIARLYNANVEIPIEWIEERNELIRRKGERNE